MTTHTIVFAGRSFKEQRKFFAKQYPSSKMVATAVVYYKNKQKKIETARSTKYNPNNNRTSEPFIPKTTNLQTRKDINF